MPRGKKKARKKRADPLPAKQSGGGGDAIAEAQHVHAATATTTTEKDYIGTSTRGGKDPLRTMIAAVMKGNAERLEQLVRKHSGKKKKRSGKKGKGKRGGGAQQINYNARVVALQGGEKDTLLGAAALDGYLGVLERLLRIKGINVNQGDEPLGCTPLYLAAQKDHVCCVERLLAEDGIKVNQANIDGTTPLNAASGRDHVRSVKALLAADGIDVNVADKQGCTPLFMACQNGRIRSVRLLLAKEGIRVNQATHDDATGMANNNGTIGPAGPMQSVTPLRIAAQIGNLDVVRVLVEQDGIDLKKPGSTCMEGTGFESPLQIARRNEHDAVVEVLLAAGAKDDDKEGAAADDEAAGK